MEHQNKSQLMIPTLINVFLFAGTLCVLASFPFLFSDCITCSHAPDWSQFIYFAPFVVIFQFGWASTQISHLSLIPELTDDENERVELNGWRFVNKAWLVTGAHVYVGARACVCVCVFAHLNISVCIFFPPLYLSLSLFLSYMCVYFIYLYIYLTDKLNSVAEG